MKYIVIDNGEMLQSLDSMDEAIEYVLECKREDIAENDEGLHQYLIKEQGPKAKPKAPRGIVWDLFALTWSIPMYILGILWGFVWFCIKLAFKILASIILGCFKLVLACIKGTIVVMIAIIAIKSNVMD